jgi:hypothetical protein
MTVSFATKVPLSAGALRSRTASLFSAFCLVLVGIWAVFDLQPRPLLLPTDHQLRLLAHLRQIAAAPHPLGTPEHDRVRDYILATLRKDGLSPEVQRATSIFDAHDLYRVAEVQNIVVRVPGTTSGHALLVAAHYDSAPVSLGAADDGAAVACMMELAGDLQHGSMSTNAVIFLFSDGEEWGMLGARSFLSHVWSKEVAAVVNLDARGSGGSPVLLQTAGDDRQLLALLGHSRAPLWAASYTAAGYHASGNDTDFSIFETRAWPGYNIAFFDKSENYHTEHDNLGRLDPATLKQLDRALQRLVRTLATTDLSRLSSSDQAAYASLPGGIVLSMPVRFVTPFALASFVFAVVLAIVRIRPSWKVVAETLARSLLGAALAVALIGMVDITLQKDLDGLMRWQDRDGFLWAALLAVSGLTIAAFVWKFEKPNDVHRPASIVALVLMLSLGGCILAWALPQAAYLLSGPALLGCVVLLLPKDWHFASILLYPSAFLWVQTIWQLATGLGMRAQWLLLPLAALLALTLSLTMLHRSTSRNLCAYGLIVLAIIFGTSAAAIARFDSDHPRTDHLMNTADMEAESARWFTYDDQLDFWNSRYLPNARRDNLRSFLGGHEFPGYSSPAPYPSGLSGSKLSMSALHGNQVDLLLTAHSGVSAIRIDIYSEGRIRAANIANNFLALGSYQHSTIGHAELTLAYFNPPDSPVPLRLILDDPHSLTVTLVDITFGLDKVTRPRNVIASPQTPTDGLYVRQSFEFLKEN